MMKFVSAQTFNSNLRDNHQRRAFFLQDDRRKRMMTRAPWKGMAGGSWLKNPGMEEWKIKMGLKALTTLVYVIAWSLFLWGVCSD